MTYKMYGALIASLGVLALMLAADEASARSGAGHRGGFASAHSRFHPAFAHSFRHRRQNDFGTFWPDDGSYFDGPSTGEPLADAPPPASGDMHYTQTYDVPWDWAHRYPPAVTPSERPYVPGCASETVTVPGGHEGKDQAVNIMRCF